MYKRVNGNRLPIKYHVTPVSVNKILLFVFIYRENLGAVPTPGKYPGYGDHIHKKRRCARVSAGMSWFRNR